MTTPTNTSTDTGRRVPRAVIVAAWATPVMVAGGFALLAIIPVITVLIGALRYVHDRAVRWSAGLLAVLYAIPLVVWRVRPDGAQSLTKDMHPAFTALIVAASAALIVAIHRRRRH